MSALGAAPHQLLYAIYGPENGRHTASQLSMIVDHHRAKLAAARPPKFRGRLTERDAILITYGDQIQTDGERPLQTLAQFCDTYLQGIITGIHLLPFYPYTSDDGFSVVDYRQVDPALGSWDDIALAGQNFGLMFDAVINHISASSAWFQAFLQDHPRYRQYFITVDPASDLSQVVRPRALPLLTTFQTPSGEKSVWTTFSADQIDLNYANPAVLLEVIDLLLFYAAQGAELIRLDAVAYLWKEPGTSCIHLPNTHRVIQLMREVLDEVAPHVMLITETNVPHRENLSYFGDGNNEAQLVYNFALPPLVLHTLQTGSARAISRWAAGLELPSDKTTFFNFLASHDGIGLIPVRGLLSDAEIDSIIQTGQRHQGLVSYKQNTDGSQSPYELNISYFDALSDPNSGEPRDLQVQRFLAAHAIQLSLTGVPGIYIHSLVGSRSWLEGVAQTGRNRTINREKFHLETLQDALAHPLGLRRKVFDGISQLLRARASRPAFHPNSRQVVLDAGPAVFALQRISADGDRVTCLQNVRAAAQELPSAVLPASGVDLLSGQQITKSQSAQSLLLAPYQTLWLAG